MKNLKFIPSLTKLNYSISVSQEERFARLIKMNKKAESDLLREELFGDTCEHIIYRDELSYFHKKKKLEILK